MTPTEALETSEKAGMFHVHVEWHYCLHPRWTHFDNWNKDDPFVHHRRPSSTSYELLKTGDVFNLERSMLGFLIETIFQTYINIPTVMVLRGIEGPKDTCWIMVEICLNLSLYIFLWQIQVKVYIYSSLYHHGSHPEDSQVCRKAKTSRWGHWRNAVY